MSASRKPAAFVCLAATFMFAVMTPVYAGNTLPTGGQFVAGSGNISSTATSTTINQSSQNGIINWQSFSIGTGNSVQFNNGNGATLNRVIGNNFSRILGTLSATGSIYLINQQGVVVGKQGVITTGGSFVASTRDIDDATFMSGGNPQFAGTSNGKVINEGQIVSNSGDVILVGASVSNSGTINAPQGSTQLVAGNDILLQPASESNSGIYVSGGKGNVTNTGTIAAAQAALAAAGGNVYALAGNNGGIIRATGTSVINGHVWLTAGNNVTVAGKVAAQNADGSGGTIDADAATAATAASGTLKVAGTVDASAATGSNANGGTVNLTGANVDVEPGATVAANGDMGSGNGGAGGAITLTAAAAATNVAIDSGFLSADGGTTGGDISVLGGNAGITSGAIVDASGNTGGGTILIGGNFHGAGPQPDALNTYVDPNALILANAYVSGNGGNVAVWSNGTTQFGGNIIAEGGAQSGNGGYVETSGAGTLEADGYVDLTAPNGNKGTYLLDPTNISIDGNVTPAFESSSGVTDSTTVNLGSSLVLWLDASNAGSVTLSYNSVTTTSASSSSSTIKVNSASNLQVGERVQIGGSSDTQLASVNDTSGIYTITGISGTSVTLDASPGSVGSGTTIYGGYVSKIADQSTAGNNATQTTAADQPLWISNGQNGLGVMSLNGTSNYLSVPTASSLNFENGSFTVNASLKPNSGLSSFYQIIGKSAGFNSGTPGWEVWLDYRQSGIMELRINDGSHGGNDLTPQPAANLTTPLNGSAGVYLSWAVNVGNNVSYTLNGINEGTQSISAMTGGISNSQPVTIGDDPHGNGNFSGSIGDITIYNPALSTNAQALVNQYESAKWGNALTGPGVIGTETGLTGTEAQQAMASTEAGATTDGYSVFSSSYLNRLSQSSNIILQASNNINLDLQGTTLTLAAGKNITLTAGNQIVTDSTGGITTSQSSGSGGNIALNATNGIVFNNAFALNSGGGNMSLNNATTLNAALNANAGAGTLTFGSTVNGVNNLTASAGTFSFSAALGGTTPLSAVSLTSVNTLLLPSVSAASILAQATGASADISIASGNTLTASGSGNALTLAAARDFVNNDGSGAVSMTGGGRWLIYSTTPGADTFGSLNSGSTAVWNATYGSTISQTGNRYVFSYQPTVNFTSSSDSKTYGVDYTSTVAADYTASGLQSGVTNAFLGDTAVTGFSGAPGVTSSGSAASAQVSDSPYAISIVQGTLAAIDGYALGSYTSSGSLTVDKATLTVASFTASNKTYDGTTSATITSDTLNEVVSGDTGNVNLNTTADAAFLSAGAAPNKTVEITGTLLTGSAAGNYTLSLTGAPTATATINQAPLTVTADNRTKSYGQTVTFVGSEFTASGLQNGETVGSASVSSNGAAAPAAAGTYAINVSDPAGGSFDPANYAITYQPGTLTVAPGPTVSSLNQILAPQPFVSNNNAFSPLPIIVGVPSTSRAVSDADTGQTENDGEPAPYLWDDSPWADTIIPPPGYMFQNNNIMRDEIISSRHRLLPRYKPALEEIFR